MMKWDEILDQYFTWSTKWKILVEMWVRSDAITKSLVIMLALVVILSALIGYFTDKNWIAMTIMFLCDFVFAKVLDGVREKAFKPYNTTNKSEIDTRYVLFKNGLIDRKIIKKDVKDCFELIDIKIDITINSNTNLKKTLSYLLAIFAGLITGMSNTIDSKNIIAVLFVFGVISFFVIGISALIPTRAEKLRELKYFMKLFCADPHVS